MHGVSSPVVVILLALAGLCQLGNLDVPRLLHRLELENTRDRRQGEHHDERASTNPHAAAAPRRHGDWEAGIFGRQHCFLDHGRAVLPNLMYSFG